MHITMLAAGMLALILVALSVRVTSVRRAQAISMGDGGNSDLVARIRAQANCSEYAPLGLLLLLLAEQGYGSTWFVATLALLFVAGRVLHPIGMALPAPNAPRVIGMVLTWTPMAILALMLLWQGIGRALA